MAKMYPALISPDTKSLGEVEIFRRLRDDPVTDNWIVLHSLDIATHISQVAGELDFVVIVPSKGVLCLEVKAAKSIRRDNGLWYYGSETKPDARGPFKQASEGMHSVRRKLVEQAPELAKVVFWSAVVFPYIEFSEKSPEWHSWQVIDGRRFISCSMGKNVLTILNHARSYLASSPSAAWFKLNSLEPDISQCKKIADLMRPDFEFYESPSSRAARRDDELKRYTQEQYDALDGMANNPRVIFTGPAGTGKTLLAIEIARRCCAEGKKTLLVCYNRLLGIWLKDETLKLQPGLTATTLHSQMLSVAGIQPPVSPSQAFWEDELPIRAVEKLLEDEHNTFQFDELIVDEAQDILHDSYLDFLDLSLKGGLNSGNWMMFGDFEKQVIYEDGMKVEVALQDRFRQMPRFSLRVNCRNTPRVAELVHLLGGLKPGYTRIRRPDNNIEPRIIPYRSDEEQKAILEKTLKTLQKENISLHEIVILSSRNDLDCIASTISADWKGKVVPLKQSESRRKIRYGTIHSFKGLEAPVVILTDIEQVGTSSSASLFYVGITRALDRLNILVNENACQEMLYLLTKSRF